MRHRTDTIRYFDHAAISLDIGQIQFGYFDRAAGIVLSEIISLDWYFSTVNMGHHKLLQILFYRIHYQFQYIRLFLLAVNFVPKPLKI